LEAHLLWICDFLQLQDFYDFLNNSLMVSSKKSQDLLVEDMTVSFSTAPAVFSFVALLRPLGKSSFSG